MPTTNFYLDTRRARKDGSHALKVVINTTKGASFINLHLDLLPTQWDKAACKVINRNDRQFLNTFITQRKQEIDNALLTILSKAPHLSPSTLRAKVEESIGMSPKRKDLFAAHYITFTNQKNGRTKEIYQATYNHLQRFARDLDTLTFNDITKTWLVEFDKYLQHYAPAKNARNIHLRNIRAVFNDAIDNELTTNYPFRKFSITPQPTAHRTLTVEQLRHLFSYPCKEWQRHHIDMFKLMFFLCGINIIDLYNLKEIVNGRVEYMRAKTHKLYSIKVEPEAQEIIDRYKGTAHLLNIADRCSDYRHYAMRLNKAIQRIEGFENITTYYMRHTWATIAAELDIPFDTISLALGHSASGARVTQVYINFNRKKIDEANRKVIDYVLYGK